MKNFKSFLREAVCKTCKGTGVHPEGGKLKIAKENPDSVGNVIKNEKGQKTGSVLAYPSSGKPDDIHIGYIENAPLGSIPGHQGHKEHFGPGTMRALLRQVRDQENQENQKAGLPPVKTMSGYRITGARHGERVFNAARLEGGKKSKAEGGETSVPKTAGQFEAPSPFIHSPNDRATPLQQAVRTFVPFAQSHENMLQRRPQEAAYNAALDTAKIAGPLLRKAPTGKSWNWGNSPGDRRYNQRDARGIVGDLKAGMSSVLAEPDKNKIATTSSNMSQSPKDQSKAPTSSQQTNVSGKSSIYRNGYEDPIGNLIGATKQSKWDDVRDQTQSGKPQPTDLDRTLDAFKQSNQNLNNILNKRLAAQQPQPESGIDPLKHFIHPEGGGMPDYQPGSSMKKYAQDVIPHIGLGAGSSRLAAALRFGNEVIAGKRGGSHSELAPFAKDKKPDEMGFVRKDTEAPDEVGPYPGYFYNRTDATKIGNKHPELKNDPTLENPKYPSQSYDFKPESGGVDPDVQRGLDVYKSSRLLKADPDAWFKQYGVSSTPPQHDQGAPKPAGSLAPQSTPKPQIRPEGGTPNYRAMAQKALQGGTPDNPSFMPGPGGMGRLGGASLGLGKAMANAPKPESTPPSASKPPENYSVQRSKPDSLGSIIRDSQGRETGSIWGIQHPTRPNELHLGGIENAPAGAIAGEQGPGQHLGAGSMRQLLRKWAEQNRQPGQDTLSGTRTSGANPGDPNAPGMGRELRFPINRLEREGGKKLKSFKAAVAPPTGGAGYSSPPAESGKKRKEGGDDTINGEKGVTIPGKGFGPRPKSSRGEADMWISNKSKTIPVQNPTTGPIAPFPQGVPWKSMDPATELPRMSKATQDFDPQHVTRNPMVIPDKGFHMPPKKAPFDYVGNMSHSLNVIDKTKPSIPRVAPLKTDTVTVKNPQTGPSMEGGMGSVGSSVSGVGSNVARPQGFGGTGQLNQPPIRLNHSPRMMDAEDNRIKPPGGDEKMLVPSIPNPLAPSPFAPALSAEGGKKPKRSEEHAGLLFYSPYEK